MIMNDLKMRYTFVNNVKIIGNNIFNYLFIFMRS